MLKVSVLTAFRWLALGATFAIAGVTFEQSLADEPSAETKIMSGEAKIKAAKLASVRNLKQVGLATWNYHKKHGALPPAAVVDKNGKPLLSWRVLILPYLDENDLYKQFKLDESWDSERNKKLLGKMPKVFGESGDKTRFRVFVGGGAAFEPQKGLDILKFADGTNNTILMVEAADTVEWTKPDDFEYGPNKTLPKLGGTPFPRGFHAGMCDGSVYFIRTAVPEKTMRFLIEHSDGGVIDYKLVFDD